MEEHGQKKTENRTGKKRVENVWKSTAAKKTENQTGKKQSRKGLEEHGGKNGESHRAQLTRTYKLVISYLSR